MTSLVIEPTGISSDQPSPRTYTRAGPHYRSLRLLRVFDCRRISASWPRRPRAGVDGRVRVVRTATDSGSVATHGGNRKHGTCDDLPGGRATKCRRRAWRDSRAGPPLIKLAARPAIASTATLMFPVTMDGYVSRWPRDRRRWQPSIKVRRFEGVPMSLGRVSGFGAGQCRDRVGTLVRAAAALPFRSLLDC
jgi:hypothetical protein